MERLDKRLAAGGIGSRREVGALIRAGRVGVGGAVCTQPARKVEDEEITVDGAPLACPAHLTLMMNKPAGVLCVSRDNRPTVIDLVPAALRRRGLFPAGRLDKDTVGLVLLTDDGALAHRLLAPRRHVTKVYHAVLDAPIDDALIREFESGMTLPGGELCAPAGLRVLPCLPQQTGEPPPALPGAGAFVEIRLTQGKYHQIKRMFGKDGRRVLWLKRVAVGGLRLDGGLAEGDCRALTGEEITKIFN
ncbi:MAG: rRNA pseudouridine synthase [Oscillospiraceae bacterium]|nr:rRNA pseudouridine synthase [Oscillospiraceae bacterium]